MRQYTIVHVVSMLLVKYVHVYDVILQCDLSPRSTLMSHNDVGVTQVADAADVTVDVSVFNNEQHMMAK